MRDVRSIQADVHMQLAVVDKLMSRMSDYYKAEGIDPLSAKNSNGDFAIVPLLHARAMLVSAEIALRNE